MATATFNTSEYTVPGTNRTVYLKYLLCSQKDIVVRSISGSVKDSGYYGINGTFFRPGTTTLVGIAINDSAQIRNYGTMNRDPRISDVTSPLSCGTFFYLKTPLTNASGTRILGGTDEIDVYDNHSYDGVTLTIANTQFAIGGSSLFPSETSLTQNTFNIRMVNQDAPYSGYRSRTAIVYIGGGSDDLNTVLLTIHGPVDNDKSSGNNYVTSDYVGVTLWELRTLINDVFAPMIPSAPETVVHAIALDGGGSTQIAYKNSSGNKVTYQTVDSYSNNNRPVYSMLSVPM